MYLRVVDAYYTVAEDGYREPTPLVHVFGRDQQWQRHHLVVEGFEPYFCVTESEWAEYGTTVADDDRFVRVESTDRQGRREEALDGTPLLRVVVQTPGDVSDLRSVFENPYEADVQFPVRFLDDLDIYQWLHVEDDALSGDTVPVEAITGSPVDAPDEVPLPRVCTYDIEVQQGGRGPPVVSQEGCEQTRNPITAISAHDSYTGEYELWVLTHSSWISEDTQAIRDSVACDINIYANPRTLAGRFCEYLTERDFDILTGWSASGFDHPYFFNYCLNEDVNGIYELSPTNDVYDLDGEGNWINSSVKGRLLTDLLTMYDKTVVSELDSKRLEDVAALELDDMDKLDIESELSVPEDTPAIDYAWKEAPGVFARYSLRDTKAAVRINEESKENVTIL